MKKVKPFKGYIQDWKWVHFPDGKVVQGMPIGHPDFSGWIRTSKVVKETPCENGVDTAIETLNSRYILMGMPIRLTHTNLETY
jgi:hypothetical protein